MLKKKGLNIKKDIINQELIKVQEEEPKETNDESSSDTTTISNSSSTISINGGGWGGVKVDLLHELSLERERNNNSIKESANIVKFVNAYNKEFYKIKDEEVIQLRKVYINSTLFHDDSIYNKNWLGNHKIYISNMINNAYTDNSDGNNKDIDHKYLIKDMIHVNDNKKCLYYVDVRFKQIKTLSQVIVNFPIVTSPSSINTLQDALGEDLGLEEFNNEEIKINKEKELLILNSANIANDRKIIFNYMMGKAAKIKEAYYNVHAERHIFVYLFICLLSMLNIFLLYVYIFCFFFKKNTILTYLLTILIEKKN